MLRVRCQAEVKVDAKGRAPLPAKIRKALVESGNTELVLAYHRGAVWGWTREHFENKVEGPLADADQFDVEVMDLAHALLSTAQDVELDNQGRIRIPARLRLLANLGREVIVHSIVNRIEIWDTAAWDARFTESVHSSGARSGMPGRSK
jgi:MraZ protein